MFHHHPIPVLFPALVLGSLALLAPDCTSPLRAETVTFQRTFDYRVGEGEGAGTVVSADFNHDGKPDLASANSDSVSVLLAKGNFTFYPRVDYPAPGGWIVLEDLNHDGNVDLVTRTGVLPGNANGSFNARIAYPADLEMETASAADINRDGRLDLVSGPGVLLGKGNGTFYPKVDLPLPEGISDAYWNNLSVADINRDGKADVMRMYDNRAVDVLQGKGNGSFQPSLAALTDSRGYLSEFFVRDFNRDAKPDVLVTYDGDCPNTAGIGVELGNGNGTFQPLTPPVGASWTLNGIWQLSLDEDFNRDGKPDVAFWASTCTRAGAPDCSCKSSFESVGVSLGQGDGHFQNPVLFFEYRYWSMRGLIARDINRDGNSDLLSWRGGENPGVALLLGKGDGNFETPFDVAAGSFRSVTVLDVNRDAKLDLVTVNESTPPTISVLLNTTR